MKNKLTTILLAISIACSVKAQDFKLSKTSGRLEINLSGAIIEGYNGNEIIFSSTTKESEVDERAKGLKAINGSGLDDNTGLGINVTEKGTTVEVNQVSKKNHNNIKIMVPKGLIISFVHEKVINHGTVKFKNVENEIEVKVQYNSVELENATGPMTIKAVYGSVDAKFGQSIKGPISILSVYGHVDAAIPPSTKANITMSTSYGEILAGAEFKLEFEKKEKDDMVSYTGDTVKGKINGGGIDIILKANYGKIYLRKN